MLKKLLILSIALLVSGCAGIAFCDKDGQPKGCHRWDPATTNGGAARS